MWDALVAVAAEDPLLTALLVALAVNAYLSVRGRRAGITEAKKHPCDGLRDEIRTLTAAMSLAHEKSRTETRHEIERAVDEIMRGDK